MYEKISKFVDNLVNLEGKVFVITGTTSGLGFVAANVAAQKGAEVVVLNRPSAKADNALKSLKEANSSTKFVSIECDLTDFSSVRKACNEIKSKYNKLYCLCNNAGILGYKDIPTKDGYDITMQVNYISSFLLTAELYPLIKAGADFYGDARIVQHTSGGRHGNGGGVVDGKVGWGLDEKYLGPGGNLGGNDGLDDPMSLKGPPYDRYYQSKLAQSVFMHAIHERLGKNSKIRSLAAHPGISITDLSDHLIQIDKSRLMQIYTPPEVGALGLLTCMMSTDANSGYVYGPGQENPTKGPVVMNKPEPYEIDPAAMKMLWEKSEAATGVKFNI